AVAARGAAAGAARGPADLPGVAITGGGAARARDRGAREAAIAARGRRQGHSRRRRIDRPAVGAGAARVAGRVDRLDLEAVAAVGEAGVALRARAGAEGGAVERAGEAGTAFGVAEAEAGAGRVARVGWRAAE